ncbi:hypothetical protein FDO65_15250 [Nakamurella flava]|uniref:Thiamine-binding protein domain-containing protein n=1 Tax=Nakamurella flava TaxID=2576308 RepID=A0A4U6QF25_9ACTN|nr:thiamine-binding protein [Nakamurella flava]TKV58854.1 hypothetical protein FDO65_15250 [Nakamurella flava]
MRVVAEFTSEPFQGEGQPPPHAQAAWEVVDASGLHGDFGPFGTEVDGDLEVVADTLRDVIAAALRSGASRITLQVRPDGP